MSYTLSREPLSGADYFAVEYDPKAHEVVMLDQRKLPGEVLYHRLQKPDQVALGIRDMVVRGAPAIGLAAAYGAVAAGPGMALQVVIDGRYFALWYCIVSYLALTFLAAPLLVVAVRQRWLTWWHAALAGAIVGAVVFSLPVLPSLFDDKLHVHYRVEQLSAAYPGAGIGLAHGLLFWVLALWRNGSVATVKLPGTSAA